jgi:hypothetical protein
VLVALVVRLKWPQLVRIPPLHELQPLEPDEPEPRAVVAAVPRE